MLACFYRAMLALVLTTALLPIVDARAQLLSAPQVPQGTMQRLHTLMVPLIQRMDSPIPLDQVLVKVIADPSINAASGSGGQFFVTSGLIESASDERLSAVLAHEVAAVDLTRLEAEGKTPDDGSSGLIRIARRMISGKDRDAADPVDAHAVTLLRRTGRDGKTMMVDALRWLARNQGNGSEFFASRPPSPERIEAVGRLR
jgi:predicted Zn-dependent protease